MTLTIEICCGTCPFAKPAMLSGSHYIGIDYDQKVIYEANRICDGILKEIRGDWMKRAAYKRFIALQIRWENVVPLKEKLILEEAEEGEEEETKVDENKELVGHGKVDDLEENPDLLISDADVTDNEGNGNVDNKKNDDEEMEDVNQDKEEDDGVRIYGETETENENIPESIKGIQ